MNDDDLLGFEPLDDELRRRLGGRMPTAGDPDAALAALAPRFRRARRRHRMIVAGSSALALSVIVAVGMIAATGNSDERTVRTPPANSAPDDRPIATTTPPTPSPTTSQQRSDTTVPAGSADRPGGDGGSASTLPGLPPSVPAPTTKTFSSAGGSVTVHVESGAMSIISTASASGYSEERTDTGPARVEVRFTNTSGTEWRIRIDLVNGEPQAEITQHGS